MIHVVGNETSFGRSSFCSAKDLISCIAYMINVFHGFFTLPFQVIGLLDVFTPAKSLEEFNDV